MLAYKTLLKNFNPAKIVMMAIPFLKVSSLIFRWIRWPSLMAIKTGIIVHQIVIKNSNCSWFCHNNCGIRTKFSKTKNTAIVVRREDLFLNLFLIALTTKGPPRPKIPCEIPPIKISLFLKNFGKTTRSKNMVFTARIISKIPRKKSARQKLFQPMTGESGK